MLSVTSINFDKIINSQCFTAYSDYKFALESLYPLLKRFSAQRKTQDPRFYDRLKRDIVGGCLMPPLTIAFVDENAPAMNSHGDAAAYIVNNIERAYILDGIQRLNTLMRAQLEAGDSFPLLSPIFLNIIISKSEDKLLYRMITLNNGQKPMTPRHQIEMLTQELFDFSDLDFDVQTEKQRADGTIKGAFNLSDISKGYLAFLTKHVHNDNQKIIDEKMDEIIVGRIMDASGNLDDVQFKEVLELLNRLCSNQEVKKWMKVNNNLIGFCAGIDSTYGYLSELSVDDFNSAISDFEEAFNAINPSKVNLGKFRRELSLEFIRNINKYIGVGSTYMMERFADLTAS